MRTLSKRDEKQFVDYCLSFYGKDGIYDMQATEQQITEALQVRIQDNSLPFDGDSMDRELVRDIMIEKFNLVFPDTQE